MDVEKMIAGLQKAVALANTVHVKKLYMNKDTSNALYKKILEKSPLIKDANFKVPEGMLGKFSGLPIYEDSSIPVGFYVREYSNGIRECVCLGNDYGGE